MSMSNSYKLHTCWSASAWCIWTLWSPIIVSAKLPEFCDFCNWISALTALAAARHYHCCFESISERRWLCVWGHGHAAKWIFSRDYLPGCSRFLLQTCVSLQSSSVSVSTVCRDQRWFSVLMVCFCLTGLWLCCCAAAMTPGDWIWHTSHVRQLLPLRVDPSIILPV